MKQLEILGIVGGNFSGEGLEALRILRRLTKVSIEDGKLSTKGVDSLSRLRQIKELYIDGEIPIGSLHTLAAMQQLNRLHVVARSQISEQEIQSIRESLPNCDIDIGNVNNRRVASQENCKVR